MSKYHSKKANYDGKTFDSKRERDRYIYLKALEEKGEIQMLRTQATFTLLPSQYAEDNGKRKCIERPVKYIADFVYYKGDEMIVEDTKGFKTADYIIKRKLMLYLKGIKIQEI